MTDNDMSHRQFWADRAANMDADLADAREYAASPLGQLEAAERRLDTLYALQADHGGASNADIAAQRALIANMRAARAADEEAAFRAEWTAEVTATRRAAWNARVTAGEFTRNGKVWPPALRAAEQAQGWRIDQLKRAVQMHEAAR